MNCLIWNCTGAGGRLFSSFVKDLINIYHLDFVAILEPRISGSTANRVIQRIGLIKGARVDVSGFSGGIRCLWKRNFMLATLVASSRYCIHLKMNPNSNDFWFFSVVYASPNIGDRQEVWQELRNLIANPGPWCLAGDFNSVISMNERVGGAAFNHRSSSDFTECLDDCGLTDLGFSGVPFTWSRGNLKQRLHRVLCNVEWQSKFPTSSNTNVPLESSDHSGLWLKIEDGTTRIRRNYFKFLGAWLDHADFENRVLHSWCNTSSWNDNIDRLTSNL